MHTKGPYLRDGRFVYASTMYALPSGKPMEVNRFSASVSPGHECPQDEAEAVARLFCAAPDLLEALRWYVANDDTNVQQDGNEFYTAGLRRAEAAIARATGEQP